MATKSSFWLRGKKGRLAGTTVYQSKGRTIQREIVDVSNPQTRAQMEQRVKWPNLVNFYKKAKPIMKYAFEGKRTGQSDYNALMSVNASGDNNPYIRKSDARQGKLVLAPYAITRGSLGTFSGEYASRYSSILTGIYVGNFGEFSTDTTIGQVSTAILANNSGLREGMQLSIIRFVSDSVLGASNVVLEKYEFIVKSDSVEKIDAYVPLSVFNTIQVGEGYYLNVGLDSEKPLAGCIIVSETISGKTSVSTESLILNTAASTLFTTFHGDSALNEAINSYGVEETAFLNSKESKKA